MLASVSTYYSFSKLVVRVFKKRLVALDHHEDTEVSFLFLRGADNPPDTRQYSPPSSPLATLPHVSVSSDCAGAHQCCG